jgi:hypothetical protein
MICPGLRKFALVAACALAASSTFAQDRPEARTVTSAGGVDLCRPRGSCFRPEPGDPIFAGDVIEAQRPGRIELRMAGALGAASAFVALTPNGRMRIAGGEAVPVRIELEQGLATVNAVGERPFEVIFGEMRCEIGGGLAAVAFREIDGPSDGAYLANRSATALCENGATRTTVQRGAIAHFRNGRLKETTPLSDSLWRDISAQR